MPKPWKWLVLFAVAPISSVSVAATNIDVLIVFSADTGLSGLEKSQVAGQYQLALTSVYEQQLDGDQTVEVWPLITPNMTYTAANKSSGNALQWMKDQNNNLASPLRIAREALGNPGADLVLMVAPDVTNPVCGHAGPGPTPKVVSTSQSESNAFAIVTLESMNPSCLAEIVIPHEVGHLLYAEHETDTNGGTLLPGHNNHAIQSTVNDSVSLMWPRA